ncbi:MAG TPA: ComEC/Rec2 family competence protein [Xanthobacteraceae bacterium]|nr:ComEC/Rec2 family competence protein [Xanthobacteraceae bacterium]
MPWAPRLPDLSHLIAGRLRPWLAAEVAPGRLMPWLPVAFGAGVAVYLSAEREPAWWAAVALAAALALAAGACWRRPVGFPLLLAAAAIAAGFATATLRTLRLSHPILQAPAYNVSISGFVEAREEREKTDRIVVRVHSIEAQRIDQLLERVRLSVKKGTAPAVGSYVSLHARLSPPLQPLRPGGYDFARDLYFQGIGASGFATGAIAIETPPQPPGSRIRFMAMVEGIRDAVDARIRAVAKGDAGAIASALLTGKRDALSAPVNDAMYISSLAHVLSISGYHMAVVAGIVFFVVRALLALVPGLALRRPIKKWAAFAAFVMTTLYLVLSGAEVATQRSYIMTAIVLVGVMADRPTLTFRTLAIAALAVLVLAPEAVAHPSFQMSFAATLALIALYQHGLPWLGGRPKSSLGARLALWGAREIVGLVLASFVAGLATTPYAAFHFHRLAPYGVIANLLAMPVVSAVVMPAGILGLIAMPFGFDAPCWHAMAFGIEWMDTVALWVASLPGAVGRVSAFGVGALALGTAGMLLLCLLRTPLRWSGAALAALACLMALRTPQPDVLVGAGGEAFAVRAPDGRLQVIKIGNDAFAIREWLAADGDARGDARAVAEAVKAREGFACDDDGCVARLVGGGLVAIGTSPAAFADDCARATLVVTTRTAPPGCGARVIDRRAWRAGGALALRREDGEWRITEAQPRGQERPWARVAQEKGAARIGTPAGGPGAPRDATPREEDLGVDD